MQTFDFFTRFRQKPFPCCLLNGKPYFSMTLPEGFVFIGMEKDPNRLPRYGKLYHSWFNLPCYITKRNEQDDDN